MHVPQGDGRLVIVEFLRERQAQSPDPPDMVTHRAVLALDVGRARLVQVRRAKDALLRDEGVTRRLIAMIAPLPVVSPLLAVVFDRLRVVDSRSE